MNKKKVNNLESENRLLVEEKVKNDTTPVVREVPFQKGISRPSRWQELRGLLIPRWWWQGAVSRQPVCGAELVVPPAPSRSIARTESAHRFGSHGIIVRTVGRCLAVHMKD